MVWTGNRIRPFPIIAKHGVQDPTNYNPKCGVQVMGTFLRAGRKPRKKKRKQRWIGLQRSPLGSEKGGRRHSLSCLTSPNPLAESTEDCRLQRCCTQGFPRGL